MFFLYNLIVTIAGFMLKIIAAINPKIRLFIEGRKNVLETLASKISADDQTIWFHAASLGEYEQGLPVIEKVKLAFPNHKIILTFFSPSGYEVRKNNTAADINVYLPLDTEKNAADFLKVVHPEMAFFIKYEFWPNYLRQLKQNNIRTYLISGIFREKQPFFKWYGTLQREALDAFEHFFVQNSSSKELLLQLGKSNVTVSGDTRFDRVAAILDHNNVLPFVEKFINGSLTVVIGSSWPADEQLLVKYINQSRDGVKFIIAPHNIKKEQIDSLRLAINRKTVLYSEMTNKDLASYDVFVIDMVGILTKIYSYADFAYVGGGFGTGIHNILEPATFGVPIVIGPNFANFAEAVALVQMGGCVPVHSQSALNDAFDNLIYNDDIRAEKGTICGTFVQMNKNATTIIMNHLAAKPN